MRNMMWALLGLSTIALADPIQITFMNPAQTGLPGDGIEFYGVISNTGVETLFLNSNSFTFEMEVASYVLTDYFFNTPLFLDPGTDSGELLLFRIDVASPFPQASGITWLGTYGLQGGIDGGSADNLGQQSFRLTVSDPGVSRRRNRQVLYWLVPRSDSCFGLENGGEAAGYWSAILEPADMESTGADQQLTVDLMRRFRSGDHRAAADLVELFYPQLRRLASSRMRREAPGHTWQTTALISELYLELVRIRVLRKGSDDGETERDEFLRLSAHLMRRLLIHHVRPLAKRVDRTQLPGDLADQRPGIDQLQGIDNALERLGQLDPNLRTVVELKVFEGLRGVEIARRMNCSEMSVSRYWNFARTWLSEELGGTTADGS